MPSIDRFCEAMRWAADSDLVGYSQSDRYSTAFFVDYATNTDCSWLVIAALKLAGFDTGGATYTGNMSAELCARGWVRLPADGRPQRGDVLLNDRNHVAAWLGDRLAQASIGEGGLVSGGARGDQTGREVNTRGYYDYPWGCYLRYAGPPGGAAEETDTEEEGEPDMKAEALIYIDDKHEGYLKGDILYWSPEAGFCYLEHPDCAALVETCNPGIARVHSSKRAPWVVRARQATNPAAAKATYGKRD